MITLLIQQTEELILRENLKRIQNEFRLNQPILRGDWKFFEISFKGAVTNSKFSHNLGFVPLDVLQTSKTGPGLVTFNFDKFDVTNLDISTTGPCVVRCFVGTYKEGAV